MSAVRIELAAGRYVFVPGETVRGVVEWTLPLPVKSFELRLFWHTTGLGKQDLSLVWSESLPTSASGRRDFAAPLPAGPYSYDGELFQLCWALEAVTELTAGEQAGAYEEVTRVDLTVSPTGTAIRPSTALGQ